MDRKLWRKNEKENFFGVYLVGWGGRKINSRGSCVFSPDSPKNFLPKIKLTKRRKLSYLMDKNALVYLHMGFVFLLLFLFLFLLFIFYFFYLIVLCLYSFFLFLLLSFVFFFFWLFVTFLVLIGHHF